MAKVHNLSSLTTIPELDLFSVNPTQGVVERNVESEYRPLAPLAGSSFIKFKFPTPVDLLLHDSYLYLKFRFRLKKADKALVTNDDWNNIDTSTYLLNTMWKQIEFIVGENELVRSPQTYAYKSYIETLLGFSHKAKKTHLSSAFWYDTSSARLEAIRPGSADPTTKDYSVGKVIELTGRLHLDFVFQNKALLGGSVVGLKLTPHDPSFFTKITQSNSNISATIEFLDAAFETKSLKCYSHLVDAHEKALRVANAKYPITRCEVKTITIPANPLDIKLDNVVNGLLPRRIFMIMVDNESYNGSYGTDAFNFQHFNLSHIVTYVNGIQYPARAFQPKFEEGLFVREYMSLFKALNQNTTETFIDITQSDCKTDKFILAINYAPDLSNGMGAVGHASQQQHGSMSIHLKFSKPLPKAINVLVYCEFDTVLEIDELRQSTLPFN